MGGDGDYAGGVGSRREAREQALDLLYEAQAKGIDAEAVLAAQPVAPHPYAATLVLGVGARRDELDATITAHARNWRPDRMPTIDLLLLRMGAFELAHQPDVPTAVAINETVELAKRFSTEESNRFVNGVLSAIAAEVRAG